MHTFSETGTGVPAFLAKLWRLVDDPETNNLICWSKDGRSFIIQNQAQFARELLPLNYKHNNMASFIRQLNMYGFHKITSIDNGGLKFDRDEMEFSHPCFKRNCPYLLEHIKRKIANTKSPDDKSAIKPEAVSKVLQDVKAMRGRQDSLDSRFSVMKQENEALWREIASLRQKHAKQQQIVNKLIQFLITIVQPTRNMTSVKRHIQLMINDTPDNDNLCKKSESDTECGPVIHELSEELMDDIAENEFDMINPKSPYAASVHIAQLDHESQSPLNVERPHSSTSSQTYDYSSQSTDDVINVNTVDASADNARQSIIQSVTSDGSEIVYHVTEVPDIHPTETVNTVPANYSDDNVLTTPMVREQMARSQLLKQKNKQRRSRMEDFLTSSSVSPKFQWCNQQQHLNSATEKELRIKSEKEIDPMIFLNVYSDNRLFTPDPSLISPNNEDSRHSNSRIVSSRLETPKTLTNATLNQNRSEELYNPIDFMTSSVPSIIFEDSSLNGGENSNFIDHFKSNAQAQLKHLDLEGKETEKDQLVRNTTINEKFSPGFAGSSNMNGASTSAAAAAAATASSTDYTSDVTDVDRSRNLDLKIDGNALAMTKYNKSTNKNSNDCGGVMRSSTADDVHGHLENMQDELESLKDLLRGDGYSLDANTLLSNGATSTALHNNRIYLAQALEGDFFNKLFNDADILGPYGLSMTTDNATDKKGSELMTYQPIYDLSDIIDINDKSELDDANISSPTTSHQIHQLTSTLNTPHHE